MKSHLQLPAGLRRLIPELSEWLCSRTFVEPEEARVHGYVLPGPASGLHFQTAEYDRNSQTRPKYNWLNYGSETSNLKKLLDDIIPKYVSHQLVCCLQNLTKHHLSLSRSGPLQLLLNKSRQGRVAKEDWDIKQMEWQKIPFLGVTVRVKSPFLPESPSYSPGSVLVLRELYHVSWEVTKLKVWEAVVSEVFQQPAASRRHDIWTTVAWPRRREQLAAGIEEAGSGAVVSVLGLSSRSCRNVAPASVR